MLQFTPHSKIPSRFFAPLSHCAKMCIKKTWFKKESLIVLAVDVRWSCHDHACCQLKIIVNICEHHATHTDHDEHR